MERRGGWTSDERSEGREHGTPSLVGRGKQKEPLGGVAWEEGKEGIQAWSRMRGNQGRREEREGSEERGGKGEGALLE